MTARECARVFKALGDVNRLAILELLKSGERCACELQDQLETTQSGLSYHMKILCDSGLVNGRQSGKWTYYSLNAAGRERAVELLRDATTPGSPSSAG